MWQWEWEMACKRSPFLCVVGLPARAIHVAELSELCVHATFSPKQKFNQTHQVESIGCGTTRNRHHKHMPLNLFVSCTIHLITSTYFVALVWFGKWTAVNIQVCPKFQVHQRIVWVNEASGVLKASYIQINILKFDGNSSKTTMENRFSSSR